uniref:Uncharacterized protein n=1 Tax=Avena sativa TaxID=4498 RepID=A0ACD5UVN6_AVESA
MTIPSSQFHSHKLLPLLLLVSLTIAAQGEGCRHKCGDIDIPFPFGIGVGPDCFHPGHEVLCDDSYDPPRAFLPGNGTNKRFRHNFTGDSPGEYQYWPSPLELVSISIGTGEARAYSTVAYRCNTDATAGFSWGQEMDFSDSPFAVSAELNVLIGVGRRAWPSIAWGPWLPGLYCRVTDTGQGLMSVATNGSCTGRGGCCQEPLPRNGKTLTLDVDDQGPNNERESYQCNYGMLAEKSWYNFSTPDMHGNKTLLERLARGVPFALHFAVGNTSCPAEGQPPPPDYACVSANNYCVNATYTQDENTTPGHVCKCIAGYAGNPYVPNGCQDIDECQANPCSNGGVCKNRLGGYDCPCKSGMKENQGGTCTEKFPLPAKVAVGVVGGISIAVVLVFFVLFLKERKRMREFFIRNGGPILEKINSIKIFKEDELKRITKNYSHILGSGAFGVVYKGFLDDNQPVAVKKSKHTSKAQKEQFANEVIIQSRVIHKNIVRLIGCCLEVDVPLLVYEFVSNGNLEGILHGKSKVPLTMDQCIVIAAESAEGLAYMHSKTSTNIQHGDVKPANILLDDSYIPKISDFGISRLIARSNDQLSEEVIGDNNYMDPVYRETGLLTNKSDVYSFGLVLYELITGSRAKCGNDCSLVINHLETYKKISTTNVRSYIQLKQDKDTELLQGLAEIARECLYRDVGQRPEMTDAAERLQNIRKWRFYKSWYRLDTAVSSKCLMDNIVCIHDNRSFKRVISGAYKMPIGISPVFNGNILGHLLLRQVEHMRNSHKFPQPHPKQPYFDPANIVI